MTRQDHRVRVPIIDVFTGGLVSWKPEYCTGREAGAFYRVRAWETAGRYAGGYWSTVGTPVNVI